MLSDQISVQLLSSSPYVLHKTIKQFNKQSSIKGLTLIWVGFLGARFEVGRVGRIMLETWNLVRKFTHICSFRKYTFQYQALFNFADASILFAKNQHFFGKNGTFTQSNSAMVWEIVRNFLVLFSDFVR